MDLEISNKKNHIHNSSFSKELSNKLNECTYSIDRFEEEFAVCENIKTGEMVNIKKELLPENITEGSIIKYNNGIYTLDIEATNKKQDEIKNMVNKLFKK